MSIAHRQLRPGHLRHHQRCTGRSYCQVREDFFNWAKFLLHLSADGLQGEQYFIYLILLLPSALIIVNNTWHCSMSMVSTCWGRWTSFAMWVDLRPATQTKLGKPPDYISSTHVILALHPKKCDFFFMLFTLTPKHLVSINSIMNALQWWYLSRVTNFCGPARKQKAGTENELRRPERERRNAEGAPDPTNDQRRGGQHRGQENNGSCLLLGATEVGVSCNTMFRPHSRR